MFSPAAMIYPQAQVLQIPPDRIHVSKVVWALSDDEGRIAQSGEGLPEYQASWTNRRCCRE
jgi:hypothetical protein